MVFLTILVLNANIVLVIKYMSLIGSIILILCVYTCYIPLVYKCISSTAKTYLWVCNFCFNCVLHSFYLVSGLDH